MRLRAYCEDADFDIIRSWDTDERSHALWCANLIPYPLTKEGLGNTITRLSSEYREEPYTAVDDDGRPVGFFRYSVRREERVGKLKFVIVDSSLRGRGFGEEMISLACEMAFSRMDVDAVELNVFPENAGAVRCYEKAGFARVREDKDNMPCGVCREFLMQLNHKNAGMQIMVDLPSRETVTLGELIPRWCFEDRLTD